MQFLPLDLTDTDSLENALSHIDHILQFGEDEEPKEVGRSIVLILELLIVLFTA